MKILITGASGFIGKNLVENLCLRDGVEILSFDVRDSMDTLCSHVEAADFVFHLAGVNRPTNTEEFRTGNTDLTRQLMELLQKTGRIIPVVFSSSTQAIQNNPYGESKRGAEEAVFTYVQQTGAPGYVYRLPNVFGKWSRPNYNSVVSTFCYNTANGLPIRVDDPNKALLLVYIDDIVQEFLRALEGSATPSVTDSGFYEVPVTHEIALGALADTCEAFAASRHTLSHTYDRVDPLMRKLYATWLSYLPVSGLSVAADMKTDARGFFAELIKSPHFGQISISRTKPGATRGNHWHSTKVEKFIVVEGEASITFRRIDGEDVIAYPVSGDRIQIIDIPPGYTHAIKNTGDTDMLTIFWAGELFDPEYPDTNFLEVQP